MTTASAGPTDQRDPEPDQTVAVYAAEDAVIDQIGPRLRRWSQVEAYLESVLVAPAYLGRFPDAPLDVELQRRSRSARSSLAVADLEVIAIRDGSWNALTVLHELAHLIATSGPSGCDERHEPTPHGAQFVATELMLVRDHCGFHAYGLLRSSFATHQVAIGAFQEC